MRKTTFIQVTEKQYTLPDIADGDCCLVDDDVCMVVEDGETTALLINLEEGQVVTYAPETPCLPLFVEINFREGEK